MSRIQVKDLTFAYEGSYVPVFAGVSFHLDTDWRIGLIGRNGRGKTTFLKLLLGEYAYTGTIIKACEVAYFPYVVKETERLTIEILRELCPQREDWELQKELFQIGLDGDALWQPFETLSFGERGKALLAALFLKEETFLLIDEPTDHLDLEGRAAVSRYLQQKKGFLLVSHDRTLLDGCVDHVLVFDRGQIEVQRGNFSSWKENKERQDAFEAERNEKLKKEVRRLEQAARQTSRWSEQVEKTKNAERRKPREAGVKPDKGFIGHKAEKMMRRSQSIQRRQQAAIEERSSLLQHTETIERLKLSPLTARQERLVELREVSVRYGEKMVCENISFEIRAGEQIALRGKNGSGKSTLLKLIAGEKLEWEGILRKPADLRISYVPQSTQELRGSLRAYAEQYGIELSLFQTILRKLGFSRAQMEQRLEDFSDGQKKKTLIARSLCEQAHLYLWDEPLNYIDVFSRLQIEALLRDYRPTLLFVEHDAAFCEQIATRSIRL